MLQTPTLSEQQQHIQIKTRGNLNDFFEGSLIERTKSRYPVLLELR